MTQSNGRSPSRRPQFAAAITTAVLATLIAASLVAPPLAQSEPTVPVTQASTSPQRARAAQSFVDSIGVVTHLHYTRTAYRRFDTIIRPRLRELGVRHVSDGAYTYPDAGPNTFYYRRLRALGREGIRFNLGLAIDTPYGERTDIDKLDDVQRWTGGAVETFAGTNEPDLSGASDWASQTRDLQRDLWHKVANDPELTDVKVIGPSPVWRPRDVGDLAKWTDFGNWHPYPGGHCPTCRDAYGASIDTRIDKYRSPTDDKPMVFTETGYHNAVDSSSDHRPASEQAAAKYVPRMLFEHFNRYIHRVFLYELIDARSGDKPRDNFGLLRNDGSRKPAFIALRNLLTLLHDPGADFRPGALAYDLSGDTDRVHSTLLQQRSGDFFLALWQERPSYDNGQRANRPDDRGARGDVDVPDQQVTVDLGGTSADISVFRPTVGTDARRTLHRTSSVTLRVPDEVVLVLISPSRQAEGAPTPENQRPDRRPTDRRPTDAGPQVAEACRGSAPSFVDVSARHPFAAEIGCLQRWSITHGTAGGRLFRPSRPLPRWQLVVFLDRSLRLEEPTPADPDGSRFVDVASLPREAREAIARMTDIGVIEGRTHRRLAPHDLVTRGQAASMLARFRARQRPTPHTVDRFVDDDRNPHESAIDIVAADGLIHGIAASRFAPNRQLSRGQMAAVIARYLQRRVDEGVDLNA